jgi:hypothetical protein
VKRLFPITDPLLAAGLMASLLMAAGGCGTPADTPAPAETTDEQAADNALLEFDLGQHRLRTYDPVSDTTRHLDFQLGATINRDDEATFTRMLESNRHRIRDRAMVAARNCEPADFLDPQLVLFRRRLRTRINQALGQPLLQDVLLADFCRRER